MKTLSVESIKDYQVCELFYDFRYEQHEPEAILGREIMAQRFENTLKRVASFFFYKKQGGTIPSYNALLNRWEKLWFPKQIDAYDIALEQHESAHGNLASYSTVATAALLQFHNDFAITRATPILIDEKYLIPVDKDLRLQGNIDLVLRMDGKFKIIKWSGRLKNPALSFWDLDFAALKMAFDYRNPEVKKATYSLYDLASTKPGMSAVRPTANDVNELMFWAKDIRDNEVFVPRRGFTAYCRGCNFDKPCFEFKGWPKHGGE